jgi:hypothetical protein
MPCKDEENAVKEEGAANDEEVGSPPVEGWRPKVDGVVLSTK